MGRKAQFEGEIFHLFYMYGRRETLQGIKGSFKHLKLGETSKGIWPVLGYFVHLNAACVSVCVLDSLQHSCSRTWTDRAEC